MPTASTYTWAATTSDVRALVNGVNTSNRIASAYVGSYGGPLSINLNMVDGRLHRVALYLLDWDYASRVEKITITNATSGALIMISQQIRERRSVSTHVSRATCDV